MKKRACYVSMLAIVSIILVLLTIKDWVVLTEVKAVKGDPLLDSVGLDLIESGYRVSYHKRKVGFGGWAVHGEMNVFNQDGKKIAQYIYHNGRWDGKATTWYESGQIGSVVFYVHGKENGVATYWYPGGNKLKEMTYVSGVQHGTENYFNKDGSLNLSIEWEHGQVKRVKIFENGKNEEVIQGTEAEKYLCKRLRDALK